MNNELFRSLFIFGKGVQEEAILRQGFFNRRKDLADGSNHLLRANLALDQRDD